MIHYSPLRYPGGKGRLSGYFKQIYKTNSLCGGVYVEPYAGGASVALSLLIDGYVSKVIINDIDLAIYAFWHSIINKAEELCRLIRDTPVDVKTWELQRKVQKERDKHDLLELGFSTFFLNRSNRSGILDGGIIGGKLQSGKWKINARFNKNELISRIQRISQYKDKIELYNLDAMMLIEQIINELPEKTFVYFDPPYYTKGKALYLNFYKKDDHIAVANRIGKISLQKWAVTYDRIGFIEELYSQYRHMKYTLNYSALKASKGEELMIFSDNLKIPNVPPISSEN
jgi:DNA adenine methylase